MQPSLRFREFQDKWQVKKLSDLGEFRRSYSFSRSYEGDGEYKHLHYGDIHSRFWGILDNHTPFPSISVSQDFEIIHDRDLIFADASEDYKDLGKAAVFWNFSMKNVIAGLHTHLFSPYKQVDSRFLMYFTQTSRYFTYIRRVGTGVSVLGLSKTNLELLEIDIPSYGEQQKIADFFTLLDCRIKKQQDKVEAWREYKKSMLQKLFSRTLRFNDEDGKEFPEWEEVKLKDISVSISYGMNAAAKEYDGENIYLRITDIDDESRQFIEEGKVSPNGLLEEKYKLKKGDILFTRTGASTGKSFFFNDEERSFYFAGFLIRVRLKETVDANFVYQNTLTSNYKEWVKIMSMRSGQPGINGVEYGEFSFQLPCLKEQQKIAELLSILDEKIQNETNKVSLLSLQKQAFIQQMFI